MARAPANGLPDFIDISSHVTVTDFASHPAVEIEADWSPDGKWIAYAARHDDNFDIWIKTVFDGNDPIHITTEPGWERVPRWSPDGQKLLFASNRSGQWNLWTVEPFNAEKNFEQITSDEDALLGRALPSGWSPDGKEIVFCADRGTRELWIMPLSGGKKRKLLPNRSYGSDPAWSPDGKWIAFNSPHEGWSEVWVVPASGGAVRLLTNLAQNSFNASWSPNGRWIAFCSQTREGYQLWAARFSGGPLIRLTNTPAVHISPRWSPDSSRIVCTRSGDIAIADVSHLDSLVDRDEKPLRSLSGVVHTNDERAADVDLTISQNGRLKAMTRIDATGGYKFDLPEGTYELGSGRGARVEPPEVELAGAENTVVDLQYVDHGTEFFVDDDAEAGGNGSKERPFRTIQEGLDATSYGDTVRLAPGTYDERVELISGVTLRGAGQDKTVVTGEAHFWLAIRPFIRYHPRRGEPTVLRKMVLRDVFMEDFMFDGGDQYSRRRAEDVAGLLALVMAVNRQDVSAVEDLLADSPELATARILSPDAHAEGSTLLHRVVSVYTSASDEKFEIAKLLIEHGADVHAEGGQARGAGAGESALGYAGFFGDLRLAELYLAHGADPNRVSSTGGTPVDATVHEGSHAGGSPTYIPCFEAMVRVGGRYHVGHLIALNHTERLKAELEEEPAKINQRISLQHDSGDVGTPLHEAADSCSADIVTMLLDLGADLNAVDNTGKTALQRAVRHSDCSEVIRLLLDRGAETDLVAPVIEGDFVRVKAMLENNPQATHTRDHSGWTLLDLAVKHGHAEIEELVRAAGGVLSQNLEALFQEAGSDHSVHEVLAQSPRKSTSPGYMHLEPSTSLDIRDQITLAAWVYRLDLGGTVIGKWFQVDSWSYLLFAGGRRGGFHLHWEDDSQTNLFGYTIPFLEWAHYAATYDGSSMKVYVNGELVAEDAVAGKRIKSTKNPVWIGASGYMVRTPGLIDDVQIWNVARTKKQIKRSMRKGLRGNEQGLVGWWPMDSKPLLDRSGHGNHGRLEGTAIVHAQGVPGDDNHAPNQVLWLLPMLRR